MTVFSPFLPGEGCSDTCWTSPQPFDILFWNALDFRACAFLFLPKKTGSFVRADPAVNLCGHSLIRLLFSGGILPGRAVAIAITKQFGQRLPPLRGASYG